MNNQLQINPPEGYEIDKDKSDLFEGIIHFKECKKVLNYNDVAERLLEGKKGYFITGSGSISGCITTYDRQCCTEPNASTTKEQLESILALNKLCNVAKYLNGDWLPKIGENGMFLYYTGEFVEIKSHNSVKYGMVYFKNMHLAQQAKKILGEEEIRKALTLNH